MGSTCDEVSYKSKETSRRLEAKGGSEVESGFSNTKTSRIDVTFWEWAKMKLTNYAQVVIDGKTYQAQTSNWGCSGCAFCDAKVRCGCTLGLRVSAEAPCTPGSRGESSFIIWLEAK
jgi:hypothetical protein